MSRIAPLASASWDCSRPLASRPEPSATTARQLRRRLAAALLALPLFAAATAPTMAIAQTSMPQILLSQDNFNLAEPAHASCSDSHVGDEKTWKAVTVTDGFGNTKTVQQQTRNYGRVLTTRTYKVKLDRSPGKGKFVSVEIWEPTDLDRVDVIRAGGKGVFNRNAQIHGIGWPPIRQGRISIANTNSLQNTFLTFTESNWNRPQTVTVKIHCAQHDAATPLPIWHFAFRHDTAKMIQGFVPGYGANRKGDNSRDNTSLRIAEVRVADSTAPAAVTGDTPGHLSVTPDNSAWVWLNNEGNRVQETQLTINWSHPDQASSAAALFEGWRIRVRTVAPAGHPEWETFRHLGWKQSSIELPGYDHAKRKVANDPSRTRTHEVSVVPVDKRWNEVEAERATKCLQVDDFAVSVVDDVNCPAAVAPPPTAKDGGICGRTKAVRDAIVGKIGGVSHCRDVTPDHLAFFVTGRLSLQRQNLSSLKAVDFKGLTLLRDLYLYDNQLTTLPAGIFDDLAGLVVLDLDDNRLTTLPAGIFDHNPKLNNLNMQRNQLQELPENIFRRNRSLHAFWIAGNPGAPFRPAAPDAGPDQTVATGAEVTLSGAAAAGGPWGDNVRLRWWQVDGPASNTTIGNDVLPGGSRRAAPTFTAPAEPTILHFRLAAEPVVFQIADHRGIGRGYDWVTITVGAGLGSPQQDAQPAQAEEPACVSPSLMADVDDRITNAGSTAGVERWTQVKNALTGQTNAIALTEVQAIHDRRTQNGWSTAQWDPVIEAMECLENPPNEQPAQAEEQPAPPATPELSLRAGSAVDEGGNATFTITADPAPGSDLTIAWTVAQSGDYLAAPGAGSRTATLTAGATSIALSVGTVDDDADEADGSVSVTLGTGTGYTIATGKGSAAVAVRDNDEPVVSIAAGSGVTEGAAASFTVSASPVPAAPLDVTLTVGQSGDFAASGETGSRTVTVPVTGSATFEVATVDDGADEPDGSIAATLGTGTGYTVAAAPDNAATVAVSDNDAAASGSTISIADATMKENWRNGYFTVTLSEPVDWPVSVHYATRDSSPVSAVAGEDYLAWQRSWQLRARFQPGQTETQIHVRLYNDSHDEDPETFEMVLFDAAVNGPPGVSVSIADGVAVGTITNDDPMPAAWLARFGRTAAEQALDGIAGRIAAPRGAGVQGTIAGQALNLDPGSQSGAANDNAGPGSLAGNDLLAQSEVARAFGAGHGGFGSGGPDGFGPLGFGQDRFGGGGAQSRSMTGREALLGSSFTATGEKDGTGGSLAFWGRAAQSSFDGREGTFSLDGEATAAMLGADYARGNWLVGMALMQSSGEGGYADNGTGPQHCPDVGEGMDADMMAHLCGGAVREGDGKVEASLTAALPYAAIQASERLKLWGAAGHGTGEVTLKPEVGGSLTADISWTMAAAGLRGDVIAPPAEGSGPALAVTSDALWARTSSDKTHELAASDSDVTRLRLGLEGSWRIATEGDGSVTPKLELGVRQDGGDAETGSGMELGTGIAWSDPGAGLSLDLSGRTLITHTEEDLENEGFSVSFHYDPKPASARGLELSLRQEIGGPSTGGLDALFASEPLSERSDSDEESRLKLEAAYGFPVFSGQYIGTPGVSFVRGSASRDYSLDWHFTPAKSTIGISFGVRATRRESEGADPQHAVGVEASVRW